MLLRPLDSSFSARPLLGAKAPAIRGGTRLACGGLDGRAERRSSELDNHREKLWVSRERVNVLI
jgi:hypothetical protein